MWDEQERIEVQPCEERLGGSQEAEGAPLPVAQVKGPC